MLTKYYEWGWGDLEHLEPYAWTVQSVHGVQSIQSVLFVQSVRITQNVQSVVYHCNNIS